MITQAIFFTAVALLVILLARRVGAAQLSATAGKTGRMFSALGVGLYGLLGSFWRELVVGARGLKKKQPRVLEVSTPQAMSAQGDPAHAEFWKEELLDQKLDLTTNYEEGEALYKAGKLQEAEQYFLKAAARNPGDAKVYAKLGLLYLNQKNHSDAIEALKMAAKIDKYNPSRHYNLALAYWGNKDVQRAIMSVREAISLDPVTQKYRTLLEQLLNG